MREMIEMHAALLAVMVGLDVIWTKAVWPDTGGTGYSQSGPGLCTVTQNGYNNYGGSNYPYYYKQQH